MRVRHLQTHLLDEGLIYEGKLETLRGLRIGIEAVYWLRSIQALKDPFADALGGVPPGIFGFVDRELDLLAKAGITPLFVFQGISPGLLHHSLLAGSRTELRHLEAAWNYLAKGGKYKGEAQKCFAVSTSRINGDFIYFIFHHLRQKGCEVLMAPYFAGSQLAHFVQQKVVQTVFGPPGLFLFNIEKVILDIILQPVPAQAGAVPRATGFSWVDMKSVLSKWGINKDQFIDACMLAGTEYCPTYPYFTDDVSNCSKFQFSAAVDIAKQGPLINLMQTFPTEALKQDHMHGYCTCKVLLQSSPILHTDSGEVRPSGGSGKGFDLVPKDFRDIMGGKLPSSLYYLMVQGVISHKLPQAFARGEWPDRTQPLVDTQEFRTLLKELTSEYREKAINLIAPHLHKSFASAQKPIICRAYWERGDECTELAVNKPTGLRWRITASAVQAELKRQDVEKVDLKFCLQWHANEFHTEGQLYRDFQGKGEATCDKDANSLAALVHFMLLEHLELIADDGGMTVIGNALRDSPKHLMEPCLVALELMKFGMLSGEPYEQPTSGDRPFPEAVEYPKQGMMTAKQKSIMLLTRVMSLVPMKLRCTMWNADVQFDLAAFHCMVKIMKRSLRHLTEASLAAVVLKDLSMVKLLPPDFLCASPSAKDHHQTHGLLPTFMLPRACMGITASFLLTAEHTNSETFHRELVARFPCCVQPSLDLQQGMLFWEDVRRCVDQMCEAGLDCGELAEEMRVAGDLLASKKQQFNMFPDPSILRGDEPERVKNMTIRALH